MSNSYRTLKIVCGMLSVLAVMILGTVDAGAQPVDLPARADHGEYVDMGDGMMIERFDSSMNVKPRPPRGELLTDYIAVWDDEDIRLTYQNEDGLDGAHSPRALTMNDTIYVYFTYNIYEPYSYDMVSLIRLFYYGSIREYPVQVTDTTTEYILFTRLLHVNDGAIHIVAGGTHLHDMNDRFIHYSRADMDGLNWQLRETWYDDDLRPNFRQGGCSERGYIILHHRLFE